jgi:iron complex transport system ATP-binding protein
MELQVQHLAFTYRSAPVLRDVCFSLTQGSYVCVLGKNGAGKSTLFKCILGLLKSYDGEILLDSIDMRLLSPKKLAGQIAYIPQMHAQPFAYSVLDMVLMGTSPDFSVFSMPGKTQRERAEHALETMGIAEFANRPYTQLSGGEQQLVLIARALAQNAKILLMDEPCASLDYGNQVRVMKKLKELAQEGYLIIQSTHNPEHVFLFADEALVLEDGKIRAFGAPGEILTEQLLEELYRIPIGLHEVGTDEVKICVPRV